MSISDKLAEVILYAENVAKAALLFVLDLAGYVTEKILGVVGGIIK